MPAAIRAEQPLDVRELVVQPESTGPVYEMENLPSLDEIEALYRIEDALTEPEPCLLAVVDDLLTTGAHLRAAKATLAASRPRDGRKMRLLRDAVPGSELAK